MKESHAFDQLRKPMRKLPDDSPNLISDEKWKEMMYVHDDTIEAVSESRTLKQKIDSYVIGLITTIIFVGFAFVMTMPELRAFIGHVFEQLFRASK